MTHSLRVRPSPSLTTQTAITLRNYLHRQFIDGGKLPGEHELAERLGVNRGTLRGALKLLEQEGLITRRQGDGTYANAHVINIKTRFDELIEYQQLIQLSGYESQRTILSVEIEKASDEIAGRLNIKPRSPLLVMRQVLSADCNPAIYLDDALPVGLIKEEYDEREIQESFFNFLEEKCHIRFDYTISEIEPCVCHGPIAEILKLEPCQAALKATATCYDENSQPFMYSQSHYNPNFIHFTVLRKRKYL